MESRIKNYLDSLFSQVPDSQKAREVKQEMLQNLSEKYTDLLAEGKAEEAAYQLTIDSIGDVSGLIAELSMERPISGYSFTDQSAGRSYTEQSTGHSFTDQNGGRGDSFTQTDPFADRAKTESFAGGEGYQQNAEPFTGSTGYGQQQGAGQQNGAANPYTTGSGASGKSKGLPAWAIALICIAACCFLGWLVIGGITRVFAFRKAVNKASQGEINSILNEISDELSNELSGLTDEGISIILSDGEGTETEGEAFEPGEVESVEVRWVSGKIKIQSGEAVSFSIESSGSLASGEEACYTLEGKTLIIDEYRSSMSTEFGITFPNFSDFGEKTITLILPKELKELTIDVVSAEISFDESVYVEEIKINSVSSSVKAIGISCEELEIDTVSGDVTVTLLTMPKEISFDCVSGNLMLTVPADVKGFTVSLDSMSGSLYCKGFDFSGGKTYTYGDGSANINCDGMSGNVTIIKEGAE